MTNNPLYDLIRSVTAAPSSDSSPAGGVTGLLAEALTGNTSQLDQLRSLFQAQIEATNANTQKLSTSPAATSGVGGSTAGEVAQSVAGIVTGGFAFNPIVAGLLKLFGGGGDTAETAPVEKFALPDAVSLSAGYSAAMPGLSPADYGSSGLPRVTQAGTQTINVHVNAMDSKSFLDRSEDIAGAVRKAMLESSSLNDVITEL